MCGWLLLRERLPMASLRSRVRGHHCCTDPEPDSEPDSESYRLPDTSTHCLPDTSTHYLPDAQPHCLPDAFAHQLPYCPPLR